MNTTIREDLLKILYDICRVHHMNPSMISFVTDIELKWKTAPFEEDELGATHILSYKFNDISK